MAVNSSMAGSKSTNDILKTVMAVTIFDFFINILK